MTSSLRRPELRLICASEHGYKGMECGGNNRNRLLWLSMINGDRFDRLVCIPVVQGGLVICLQGLGRSRVCSELKQASNVMPVLELPVASSRPCCACNPALSHKWSERLASCGSGVHQITYEAATRRCPAHAKAVHRSSPLSTEVVRQASFRIQLA